MSSSPALTIPRGRQFRLPGLRWGPVLRGVGRVVFGVVAALLIFLAFSSFMRTQTVTLPSVTGEAAVGRTELTLNDAGRTDPFAADGRSRELLVWIWYPATEGATGELAPYLPSAWAPLVNNMGPLSQDLTMVRTNSVADAPLEGMPPVVVLMPGLEQPVASYSSLAEDLASHGFAVVGINPTESTTVVFPDGHVVAPTAMGGIAEPTVDAWYETAERVTNVWVADAQFVLAALSANPPEIGALDFEHPAYVGHSVGGAAAFEACRQDTSCVGAVDLDGTLWTEVRHAGLSAPSLLLQRASAAGCGEFCDRAQADFANVRAAGNAEQFVVSGTEHMTFSDIGFMWGPATASALGEIEAERMSVITRDLVRSFLDVHVLGSAPETFFAATGRYPELSE